MIDIYNKVQHGGYIRHYSANMPMPNKYQQNINLLKQVLILSWLNKNNSDTGHLLEMIITDKIIIKPN